MRSRDGNNSFLLTVSIITTLLFPSLALSASEYLISYRYLVQNAILYNEVLDISKSMQKCSGQPGNSIIFTASENNSLREIIQQNNEEFVDFIHTIGLSVKHNELHNGYRSDSTTLLTLRTTCFKVDFNDTFVRISALK